MIFAERRDTRPAGERRAAPPPEPFADGARGEPPTRVTGRPRCGTRRSSSAGDGRAAHRELGPVLLQPVQRGPGARDAHLPEQLLEALRCGLAPLADPVSEVLLAADDLGVEQAERVV